MLVSLGQSTIKHTGLHLTKVIVIMRWHPTNVATIRHENGRSFSQKVKVTYKLFKFIFDQTIIQKIDDLTMNYLMININ